jgi:hypothetical protein
MHVKSICLADEFPAQSQTYDPRKGLKGGRVAVCSDMKPAPPVKFGDGNFEAKDQTDAHRGTSLARRGKPGSGRPKPKAPQVFGDGNARATDQTDAHRGTSALIK